MPINDFASKKTLFFFLVLTLGLSPLAPGQNTSSNGGNSSTAVSTQICDPRNIHDPAPEFMHVIENDNISAPEATFKLRAAWAKLNLNNDGQTNLRKCQRGIVAAALRAHHYTIADILMGPEYNFSPSEFNEDAPQNQKTAIQNASLRCDAEQILILRLYGVPDSEASKELRQVEENIVWYSPSDGKIHKDRNGDPIGHHGNLVNDWSQIWNKVKKPVSTTTNIKSTKLQKEDENGKAFNKFMADQCRAAQWALTVPLSILKQSDLTGTDVDLEKTAIHGLLSEKKIPDWQSDQNCKKTPTPFPCESPVHRILQAIRHVEFWDKKLGDPDQYGIYVPRGTDSGANPGGSPAAGQTGSSK